MPIRLNCWEFKKCGRQPNGNKADELGVCPAANEEESTGLNSGNKAGRICWAVAGTFCGGKVQGTYAEKEMTCMSCDFYKRVREEEGSIQFKLMKPGQVYTQCRK
jgi:hypothetical protein